MEALPAVPPAMNIPLAPHHMSVGPAVDPELMGVKPELELGPASPSSPPKPSASTKTSWVWQYFSVEIVDGKKAHICQAPKSPGSDEICRAKLTPDKTASTKSLSRHLDRRHGITANRQAATDPKPPLVAKPRPARPKRKLNHDSLKEAIFDFVVHHELPLATVEHPTFTHLLEVCNPLTKTMAIQADNLTDMIGDKYQAAQDSLKEEFAHLTSRVSITMNVWDLRNDTSVLEISAHWVRDDWSLIDATLSITKLEAIHTEGTVAATLKQLLDFYGISDKLFCITADNALANANLAAILAHQFQGFDPQVQLLRCMGHVINLAAKTGLKAFGGVNTADAPSFDYVDVDQNSIPVSPENLITITGRLRGLAIHVENTPQQKDFFIHNAKIIGINPPEGLIHDNSSRWNSAYHMFARALQLRAAIDFYCNQDASLRQYSLSSAEWNKVEQLIRFLKPLDRAATDLTGPRYPTFAEAALTYEWVVRRTDNATADYATEGLLAPLQFVKKTLDDYQRHILLKPVYLCSVILDPRSKMKELDTTTLAAASKTSEELKTFFIKSAESFSKYLETDQTNTTTTTKEEISTGETLEFSDGNESDGPRRSRTKRRKISDLNSEIESYLSSDVEDPHVQLPAYWTRKKQIYPTLEAMARSFLAVASTSAPSSRVFSSGDGIRDELRMSMVKPDHWEPLVYLKSWSESGLI